MSVRGLAEGVGAAGGGSAAPGRVRAKMLAASTWSLVSLLVLQVLRLGSNLVLARLLAPDDFGTAAIIMGVLSGLQMFSDIGLSPAVVRSVRGEEAAFLRTAFTLQSIRGLCLGAAMCVVAWPVSRVYGAALLPLFPVAGAVAVVAGLSSSSLLLAARRMDQRRLSIIETASFAVQLAVTMGWALASPSVWALVAGNLAGAASKSVLSHAMATGERDRFGVEPEAAREILTFGRWIFVSTAVTFLSMQSDRLVLGVVVPIGVVGVYSMATMLARLPGDVVARLTSHVLFPALADVGRGDTASLLRANARARRVILPALLASCVGMGCAGPALLLAAYPASYHGAVWMLPMLVFALWFSMLQTSVDRVLLVSGHTRVLAVSNAARAVIAVGGGLGGHAWLGRLDGPGEHTMGVAGFIAGLGLSGAVGYLVVAGTLTRMGARLLWVDLGATLCLGGLLWGTWAATRAWSSAGLAGGALGGAVVVGAGASLAACGWAGAVIRRELRGPRR